MKHDFDVEFVDLFNSLEFDALFNSFKFEALFNSTEFDALFKSLTFRVLWRSNFKNHAVIWSQEREKEKLEERKTCMGVVV